MLGLKAGLVLNFGRITLKGGIARIVNESKAECRTRLLRENPAAFRNLLVEEDGVTPDVANRMQLAGDIGLVREGAGETFPDQIKEVISKPRRIWGGKMPPLRRCCILPHPDGGFEITSKDRIRE